MRVSRASQTWSQGASHGCKSASPAPVGPGLAELPNTAQTLPGEAGTRARTSSGMLDHPPVVTVTVGGSLGFVIKEQHVAL